MAVNIKRGFNRVYILLAALWAFYCVLLFPLQKQAYATREFDQNILMCQSNDDGHMRQCLDLVKESWLAESRQWELRSYYKWAWPLLLLAVIALPVIVYGCARGAATLALWVWNGFRVASS